jgi:hypothetical protein
MKIIPQFAFTWGREPIDIRFGVMFGSQYDYVLFPNDPTPQRCLRFDFTVGMVWACLRVGVILH